MPKIYLPQYDVTINAPDDKPIEQIQAEIEARKPDIEAYAAQRLGVSPDQLQQAQGAAFSGQKIPLAPAPDYNLAAQIGRTEPYKAVERGIRETAASIGGAGVEMAAGAFPTLSQTYGGEMFNPLEGQSQVARDVFQPDLPRLQPSQRMQETTYTGALGEMATGEGPSGGRLQAAVDAGTKLVSDTLGIAPSMAATVAGFLVAGPIGAGAMGGFLESASQYENAKAQGKSEQEARKQAGIVGAGTGILNAIPFLKAFDKVLPDRLKTTASNFILRGLAEGATETAEGALPPLAEMDRVPQTTKEATDLLVRMGAGVYDESGVFLPAMITGGLMGGSATNQPRQTPSANVQPEAAASTTPLQIGFNEPTPAQPNVMESGPTINIGEQTPQGEAIVNLGEAQVRQTPKRLQRFETLFDEASQQTEGAVPPELLMAVAQVESAGNPKAVSPKGAKGLMQIMDATGKELGVTDPFDPKQAIGAAARYIAQGLQRHGGDLDLALADYNAGPGNVDKYGGVPPFKETQDYIRKVRSTMASIQGDNETAALLKVPTESLQALTDMRAQKGTPLTAQEVRNVIGEGDKESAKPIRDWVNREVSALTALGTEAQPVEPLGVSEQLATAAAPVAQQTSSRLFKPADTFAEFEKQYRQAFDDMKRYTPNQVGSQHYADRMSQLYEAHPEWADAIENRPESKGPYKAGSQELQNELNYRNYRDNDLRRRGYESETRMKARGIDPILGPEKQEGGESYGMRQEARQGQGEVTPTEQAGGVQVPPPAKQPWEMTRAEFVRQSASIPASGGFAARANAKIAKPYHRSLVDTALREGKPVPPAVLADYPDLAAKYQQPSARQSTLQTAAQNLAAIEGKAEPVVSEGQARAFERLTTPQLQDTPETLDRMTATAATSDLPKPQRKAAYDQVKAVLRGESTELPGGLSPEGIRLVENELRNKQQQETPNAIEARQQQQNRQPERVQISQGGPTAEAGGGNRPVQGGQEQRQVEPLPFRRVKVGNKTAYDTTVSGRNITIDRTNAEPGLPFEVRVEGQSAPVDFFRTLGDAKAYVSDTLRQEMESEAQADVQPVEAAPTQPVAKQELTAEGKRKEPWDAVVDRLLSKGYKEIPYTSDRALVIGGQKYQTFESPEGARIVIDDRPISESGGNVKIMPRAKGVNEITLSAVQVEPEARGEGIGRRATQDVFDSASEVKVDVLLEPAPLAGTPASLDREQLTRFYKRMGARSEGESGLVLRKKPEKSTQELKDMASQSLEFYKNELDESSIDSLKKDIESIKDKEDYSIVLDSLRFKVELNKTAKEQKAKNELLTKERLKNLDPSSTFFIFSEQEGFIPVFDAKTVNISNSPEGYEFFLAPQDFKGADWKVYESSTGLIVGKGKTRREAIQIVNDRIHKVGAENFAKMVSDSIKHIGQSPRSEFAKKPTPEESSAVAAPLEPSVNALNNYNTSNKTRAMLYSKTPEEFRQKAEGVGAKITSEYPHVSTNGEARVNFTVELPTEERGGGYYWQQYANGKGYFQLARSKFFPNEPSYAQPSGVSGQLATPRPIWKMPFKQYAKERMASEGLKNPADIAEREQDLRRVHRRAVQDAIAAGEKVPVANVKEYGVEQVAQQPKPVEKVQVQPTQPTSSTILPTPVPSDLMGRAREDYGQLRPILDRQVGNEISDNRKLIAFLSVIEGPVHPDAKTALTARFKEIAPSAAAFAAENPQALPINLRDSFGPELIPKPAQPSSVQKTSLEFLSYLRSKAQEEGLNPIEQKRRTDKTRQAFDEQYPGSGGKAFSDFMRTGNPPKKPKRGADPTNPQAGVVNLDAPKAALEAAYDFAFKQFVGEFTASRPLATEETAAFDAARVEQMGVANRAALQKKKLVKSQAAALRAAFNNRAEQRVVRDAIDGLKDGRYRVQAAPEGMNKAQMLQSARDVLSGKSPTLYLPERLANSVQAQREFLDNASRYILENGIATTKGQVAAVKRGIGLWLRRSYEVHDNKNWVQEVQGTPAWKTAIDEMQEEWKEATETPEALTDLELVQFARRHLPGVKNSKALDQIENALQANPDPETLDPEVRAKVEEALRALPSRSRAEFSNRLTTMLSEMANEGREGVFSNRLGSQNRTSLMRRKTIPKWLRDVMGEYTDPEINFARSAEIQAQMIGAWEFSKSLYEAGKGKFIFDDIASVPDKMRKAFDMGEFTQLPDNPKYGMLAGKYVSKEMRAAMDQTRPEMSKVAQLLSQASGTVRWLKTIGNVYTGGGIRNMVSSGFAAAGRGDLPVATVYKMTQKLRSGKSLEVAAAEMLGIPTGEGVNIREKLRQHHEDMVRRGVHDTEVDINLTRERLRNGLFGKKAFDPNNPHPFKTAKEFSENLWLLGDNFWKSLSVIENTARYEEYAKKQGWTEKQLQKHVDNIVRNTTPTYDAAFPIVNKLKNDILNVVWQDFVTWPAERIRNKVNLLKLIKFEMQSKDPKLVASGSLRLASLLGSHALMTAGLSVVGQAMLGSDDENEDWAVRELMPEWMRYAPVWYWGGRNPDGTYQVADLGYSDADSMMNKVLLASFEGNFDEAANEFIKTFFGASIAFDTFEQLRLNRKESGEPVWLPADTWSEAAYKAMRFATIQAGPPIAAMAWQGYEKYMGKKEEVGSRSLQDRLWSTTGASNYTINPETSFGFKAKAASGQFRDIRSSISKEAREYPGQKLKDIEKANAFKRDKAAAELVEYGVAARVAGVSPTKVKEQLKEADIRQDYISVLMKGIERSYKQLKADGTKDFRISLPSGAKPTGGGNIGGSIGTSLGGNIGGSIGLGL